VSRAQLEREVDRLAAEHSGPAFARAIQELAASLDADETTVLQEILVERAVNFDQAVMERVDARGWLRRQWDRATLPPRGR
jgi:hypothetical protein